MLKKIFLVLVLLVAGGAPTTGDATAWADDMLPSSEIQNIYVRLPMYFPNDPSSQVEATENSETSNALAGKEETAPDKSEAKTEPLSGGENQSAKDLIAAGDVALAKEQKAQARTLFGQATVELQKSSSENKIELAKVLNKLASTYDLSDSLEREQAKASYKKAIYLNKNVDSDIQAAALSKLSIIAMANGQLSQAEALGRQSLEVSKTAFGEGALQTGESLIRLAVVLHSNNKIAEAEPLAQQARDVFEKVNDSNKLVTSLAELASLRMAQNDAPAAEKLYQQQLCVLEAAQLPIPLADCLEHLGSVQKSLSKENESQANFTRALELREKSDCPRVFRFIEGSPSCTHVYNNGAVTEQICAAGLHVSTALQGVHDKMCADVKILNSGDKPIDVSLNKIKLIIKPQSKECKQVDVDQWAASIVHSARVAAGVHTFVRGVCLATAAACASMPAPVTTTSYSSGNVYASGFSPGIGPWNGTGSYSGTTVSTTYVPNYSGQIAVQNMAAGNRRRINNDRLKIQYAQAQAQSLQQVAFRTTTIMPGTEQGGKIFFIRGSQLKDAVLKIEINGSTYEFPFTGSPKSI